MIITSEQRDAIDAQIRRRVMEECGRESQGKEPIEVILYARMSLRLGLDLEKTCPYMRDCNIKSVPVCIAQPYRDCSQYKCRLAGDILSNAIKLEGVVA